MKDLTRRFATRTALVLGVMLTTLLMGMGTASAQDAGSLTKYLSGQNDVVMGVNVSSLRSNKYFDQLIDWARTQAGGGDLLEAFEKESGLNIDKDIDAIAVAFRSTGAMQQQQQNREFAMAISGSFKADKLLAAIKKQGTGLETKKISGLTLYKNQDVWLAVPKDGLALMTAGDDAYAKKNIATFANKKNTIRSNKLVKAMLGQVDTGGDVWIAGDMTGTPSQSQGPTPNSLGMEIDFGSGLNMDMIAQMESAKDAKTSATEMKKMQSQGASNPFVTMLGAKPLIDNLEVKADNSKVTLATSMTAKEFDAMVAAVKQLAKSRGLGGSAPAGSGQPDTSKESKDGADADFN